MKSLLRPFNGAIVLMPPHLNPYFVTIGHAMHVLELLITFIHRLFAVIMQCAVVNPNDLRHIFRLPFHFHKMKNLMRIFAIQFRTVGHMPVDRRGCNRWHLWTVSRDS
jgi:hypothetical protein